MIPFTHNDCGSVKVRQSKQRHRDQAYVTNLIIVFVAGIIIGIAVLAIIIGALQWH